MPYKDKTKQKLAQQKHYLDNKGKYKESSKTRKSARKEWFKKIKLNCVCSVCGFDDYRCLDFHHIEHDKLFGVSDGVKQGFAESTILDEMKKCVVLCSNCHRMTHYNETEDTFDLTERIKKLLFWMRDFKISTGCQSCSCKKHECLDFHHLKNKRRNVSKMVWSGYSLESIQNEMAKCIVLCANCHRITHEGNVWNSD